ncbi:MAG TPA: GAF domain-containing SpoIIE family protein phosphatase [Actinomycetota bacterium]|nr:GAF domain-containing SpoIIE family protein phosphatase [Actinomycetota bacterium]
MTDHPDEAELKDRLAEIERTLDSLRQDSEVAHVLLGLSGVLAEIRSVEETLELAVGTVVSAFSADRCFAVTIERGEMRVLAHAGYDEGSHAHLSHIAESSEGLPLIGRALSTDEPLFVPDAGDSDLIDSAGAEKRQMGAFIGLPLVRWGENLGGLGVEFDRPRRFTAKDVALARGIARLLGIALVNARRFNMLASLRAFGLSVARKLSLPAVIEDVAWGGVELLSGDSAKVYFLDSTHSSLVEAGGYEDERTPHQSPGRIDLHKEPWSDLLVGKAVVATDLGTKEDPLSVVAAPIPGEQAAILGAVLVFFQRELAGAPEELEALNVLAGQAGMAVENANRFERQRQVARSLQEGLLSTEMPELDSCTVAAVYEPASGDKDIGGDFYDVFPLSDGLYGVAVGDVSGKGAEAAARTAMVKYMMRAFAISDPSPATVMANVNNALTRDLEDERFATMVYGLLDPRAMKFIIARGGHPPPLLYRHETATVEALEDLEGSILGAFEDVDFVEADFTLRPGDVFLLYTDGLIEARSESGLFYGRKRIEEALKRHADEPVEELVRRLYREAADFGVVGDDTVVFALRCRGEE